jgi:hypothetical protein
MIAATAVSMSVHADNAQTETRVALVGAVAFGGSTTLVLVGGSVFSPFTVPTGEELILTDIIFSPQADNATGPYFFSVFSSNFSTTLSLTSSALEPSSLQTHLITGMAFAAQGQVTVTLAPTQAAQSVSFNISAFGYLQARR